MTSLHSLRIGALATVLVLTLTGCVGVPGGGSGSTGSRVTTPTTSKDGSAPKFADGSIMKTIQERGRLVAGVTENMAPFSSRDANVGSWQGFDIDLVQEIARSVFGTNIEGKITYVPLDPRDRERALGESRVDLAVGRYVVTVPRKRFVDFAGPYYTSTQDILLRAGTDNATRATALTTVAQLTGRKACVVTGSTNLDALKAAIPGLDPSLVDTSVARCATALQAGTVDAVAADHVDLLPTVKAGGRAFSRFQDAYGSQPYGVGVKLGANEWRSHINSAIENWSAYDSVYRKTTGDTTAAVRPAVDRY